MPTPVPENSTPSSDSRPAARSRIMLQAMPCTIRPAEAMPPTTRQNSHAGTLETRPMHSVDRIAATRPARTAKRAGIGTTMHSKAPAR